MSVDSLDVNGMADFISSYEVTVDAHKNAVKEATNDLSAKVEAFFKSSATIEHFMDWKTAAPLYRAGWALTRESGEFVTAFERGFTELVDREDTYLDPVMFAWKVKASTGQPVYRIGAIINDMGADKERLLRTADLTESLLVPMREDDPNLSVEVYFYVALEGIKLDSIKAEYVIRGHDDGSFSSGKPYMSKTFQGTMREVFQHLVDTTKDTRDKTLTISYGRPSS